MEEFSHDDLVTIYLGITSYVAEKRGKQNQEGVMMSKALDACTGNFKLTRGK